MRLNKTTHSFRNPGIFVGVYAAAITIGIPGTPITIAGGAIFGTPWGIILNTVGANLGANLSFFIARKLGSNTIKKIFKYDLGVYSDKTRAQDFWRLLSLRLFPLVPFTALNFACGFTKLRWRTYFLATAFGMLPWTILYTMFADTALDAYGEYSMDIVGKLLLLIAIILISLKMSVFLMRFLDEVLIEQSIRFFTRTVKSVLVDTFISIVKKLFVSKAVIFSSLRR